MLQSSKQSHYTEAASKSRKMDDAAGDMEGKRLLANLI
jgi:hypothetical protein